MAKRSAEERLREFAGAERGVLGYRHIDYSPQRQRAFTRLLREVKRECAERVLPLFDDPSTWSRSNQSLKNAVRAAILGGPRRG